MTFNLSKIAELLNGKVIGKPSSDVIRHLTLSSKEIAKDSLFIAVPGTNIDGHNFVADAFENGALAALVSDEKSLNGKPGVIVTDTRQALGKLGAAFYNYPSEHLKVIGITGTNGKTTTNWLIFHVLVQLGNAASRIGTLGIETRLDSSKVVKSDPGNLTTPDALSLQKEMRLALDSGAKTCVMEVSSHALAQERASNIEFDVAVFTNLTRDHLDYHSTMDEYFAAKLKLFELLSFSKKNPRVAVLNGNSEFGDKIRDKVKDKNLKCYTFGNNDRCDFQILSFTQTIKGSQLKFVFEGKDYQLESPLIGNHNAENIAAAVISVQSLGFDINEVCRCFTKIPQVPGRLESVGSSDVGVYVDYAHTPDALENVLKTLRPIVSKNLWCVFGCGGDRDRGKRPVMGKVAGLLSDKIVVTSDNPRTEDPNRIIEDILACGIKPQIIEADRRLAIEGALKLAGPGDVVLIAGKGHEDYQIIGKEKFHFSDVEEVQRILKG